MKMTGMFCMVQARARAKIPRDSDRMKQLTERERVHRQILGWRLGFETIRKNQTPIMMEMLSPREGDRILDAGCGRGNLSFSMGKGPTIVALDISSNNIKNAKSMFAYSGYRGFPIVGSVTHLPLRSHIFDKVLLSSVLQHVQDPTMVLEEIHRVLKTTGVFVINVPSDRPYLYLPSLLRKKYANMEKLLWNGFRAYHKWSADTAKKILEDTGFNVLSVQYSPKYLAAFIYEVKLGLTTSSAPACRTVKNLLLVTAPIMYLLSKLDYILPKKTRGSEFIMKAEKLSCGQGR